MYIFILYKNEIKNNNKKQHNSTILTNKQNIILYKFCGIMDRNKMIKNCFLFIR